MAAVTFSSGTACHKVVGELAGGLKMVFSDFVADDGTTATIPVRIDPLKNVFAWAWGQKENNTGGSAAPVTVAWGGTVTGNTTTSSNIFNIKTLTTGTSGLMTVTIMSIGV